MTLAEVILAWGDFELNKPVPRWDPKDKKAVSKFHGIVRNHLAPAFPKRGFAVVTAEQLEEFLTDLYKRHSSYATSLRAWLKDALMYAERQGWCVDGYAKVQRLDMLLRAHRWRRSGPRLHHAALPVVLVPAFMFELRLISGVVARALEFLILTVSRANPVVLMKWDDVDLQKGIWRCPQVDMKVRSNGDHIVYLSAQAIRIIESMPRILPGGAKAKYVFSAFDGNHICSDFSKAIASVNSKRKARGLEVWTDPEQSRLAGKPMAPTAHGFRASFKSWSRSEQFENWKKFDAVAVERCMHHYVQDAYAGAYDREDFPEQQRRILQEWANYCYSYHPE